MRRCFLVLPALALALSLPGAASAQMTYPKVVAKTFDQDSVQAALTLESEAVKFVLVKADKHGAIFTREEGSVVENGRQVQIQREVTFHFEKAKTGIRVVATEELIVHAPGGADDRRPVTLETRAPDLQDVLNRVKARIGPGASGTPDSAASQP